MCFVEMKRGVVEVFVRLEKNSNLSTRTDEENGSGSELSGLNHSRKRRIVRHVRERRVVEASRDRKKGEEEDEPRLSDHYFDLIQFEARKKSSRWTKERSREYRERIVVEAEPCS